MGRESVDSIDSDLDNTGKINMSMFVLNMKSGPSKITTVYHPG